MDGIDRPMRIRWADPKKESGRAVLHNRIMALNLHCLPSWQARLAEIEQRVGNDRADFHDMLKWRLGLRNLVANMAMKMREVGRYLKSLGVERTDVPLPQVRLLSERAGRAITLLSSRIERRENRPRSGPIVSQAEPEGAFRSLTGRGDTSDQIFSGTANPDLPAFLDRLSGD